MKSLYQLERPHQFKAVVGQEKELAVMRASAKKGDMGHAILLIGPAGTGKTTLGRIIAELVNCENPQDGEPCCKCASCKAIISGTSPDVIELDAASNNGVDDIRNIIEQAGYTTPGKEKVFILDECHMLSASASNALLKTLEEPPANVLFILCTTEADKVLDTIKSRCRIYHLKSIGLSDIERQVKAVCEKHDKQIAEDAASMIALHSNGSMRNALSILECFFAEDTITAESVAERLGAAGEDGIFDVLDGITNADGADAVKAASGLLSQGKTPQALVRSLLRAINDTESVMNGADVEAVINTAEYKKRLKVLSEKADIKALDALAMELKSVLKSADSSNADLYLQLALRSAVGKQERIAELEGEVEKLSRKVAELETRPVVSAVSIAPAAAESEETSVTCDDCFFKANCDRENGPCDAYVREGSPEAKEAEAREAEREEPAETQVLDESPEEQAEDAENTEAVWQQESEEPGSDEDDWANHLTESIPFDDDDLSEWPSEPTETEETTEETAPADAPVETSAEEVTNIVSFPEQNVVSVPEKPQAPAKKAVSKKEKPATKTIAGLEVATMSADDFFATTTKDETEEEPAEQKETGEEDTPSFGFNALFGDSEAASTVWAALGDSPERDKIEKVVG